MFLEKAPINLTPPHKPPQKKTNNFHFFPALKIPGNDNEGSSDPGATTFTEASFFGSWKMDEENRWGGTVGGRNPAPVDRCFITLFTRFLYSFHQQYFYG